MTRVCLASFVAFQLFFCGFENVCQNGCIVDEPDTENEVGDSIGRADQVDEGGYDFNEEYGAVAFVVARNYVFYVIAHQNYIIFDRFQAAH